MENWKAWVDDSKVEFDKLISTALDQVLYAIDIFCILFDSRIFS